ncbi:MAG: chondroitinase-B domain-containing protein, partial [Chitinophagaceae bacterium]
SIKSCGNIIRNNVFKECQGAVVLRHGNNNTVEGNIFLGNGKESTGGVRVINECNWIVNNFFSNCRGEGFRSPLAIMNGVFNSPPNRYLPVRDAVIAHNTFFNCNAFSLGEGSDTERSVAPKNVYLFNNVFFTEKERTLCYKYDKTDSIFFSGNIFNSPFQPPGLPGFDKRNISLQKWSVSGFPFYKTTQTKKVISDSLQQLAKIRIQKGFPASTGCDDLSYFKTLYNQSKRMGIQWKPTPTQKETVKAKPVQCKDAVDLYKYLTSNATESIVQLTGTEYIFDQPLIISKNTTIRGSASTIIFKSVNILGSLFEIKGSSMLKLENLKINADPLQLNHFINADSGGTCIHFKLYINNCRVSGLQAISFFTAQKYSYADEISISNTTFRSNTCNLFSLKDELDNKGYYNVEKIVIENCLFENNNGSLLNIYRGGNDESTMGPKLFFTNNKIKSCNNSVELIKLFGVQQSSFLNNSFTGSNQNKEVLIYIDNVRAAHLQKNNTLINSGVITVNKFVNKTIK